VIENIYNQKLLGGEHARLRFRSWYKYTKEIIMKKISRADAQLNNLKYYYTGNLCKQGHTAQRRVANGECLECATKERNLNQQRRSERFLQKHGKEYAKQKSKQHYIKHKEEYITRARVWNDENKNAVKAMQRDWRARNTDYMQQYLSRWWKNNPHKAREYQVKSYTAVARQNWYKSNKGLKNFYTRMRQSAIKQATPTWARLQDIKNIYILAGLMTQLRGEEYHVDHIVPIKGKGVCGLHVPWNLQIISKQENLRKGNKHQP